LKPSSHRVVTEVAFDLLSCTEHSFPFFENKSVVACESEATDYYMDLEFVDVGGFGSDVRDDPHETTVGLLRINLIRGRVCLMTTSILPLLTITLT